MRRQCTWCNGIVAESLSPDRRRIADSVCGDCSENFVFQMGVPLQTFLDSLPAPIFVVDGDVVVQAANKRGYAVLKKNAAQVLKQLGGVVFECAYARLPEGCGRTVHCSGCAIRRSVYHTMETGKSLIRVPAVLNYGEASAPEKIAMHISTEKMGNIVLLRVDAPEERRTK
jgi:hypothetical protein